MIESISEFIATLSCILFAGAAVYINVAEHPALTSAVTRVDAREAHGRTALHVAAFGAHQAAMRALVAAGADPNALENDH